jgi:hypothetical protein
MNTNEQTRLAAAIAILRPDWPQESLRTFIARDDQLLAKRPYQDAAVALVFVALDPATKTPARVNEPGPWWRIGRAEPEPVKGVRCPRCRHTYMPTEQHECRQPTSRVAQFTDQLRAELATVRADQCPHGPRCADCKKARDHADEETAHG